MIAFFNSVYNSNRRKFLIILLLNILSGLTAGVGTLMLLPMLSVLEISPEESSLFSPLISSLSFFSKTDLILVLLFLYVLLVSLKAFLTRSLSIQESELVEDFTLNLRTRFYDAVLYADWEDFKSCSRAELTSMFINETGRISRSATLFIHLISLGISILTNVILACLMSVPATAAVLLFGTLFFFFFSPFRKKARDYGKNLQTAGAEFLSEITNQMNGIREIRSYHVEKEQQHAFLHTAERFRMENLRFTRLSTVPQLLLSIGSALLIAGTFLISYLLFHVSIARIAVLIYIFGKLWPAFSSSQSYLQTLHSSVPVYENICSTIKMLNSHRRTVTAATAPLTFTKEMCFRQISFAYRDGTENVLNSVDFSLKKGEITAFAGKSGAGKSTLIDIILGYLTPVTGYITIDGKEIDRLSYARSLKAVSYIPQDPLLINDTVKANLLHFHPNASEAEMTDALKQAQIWDVVKALPQGINTVIGDRGIRLSGGERQRVIIARALMGNPQLLVLDEATSSLDQENENKIREVLESLRGNLTILIIAHRISTIQKADKIYVIENNTISETGTFYELAQNPNGYFHQVPDTESRDNIR